MPYFKGEVVPLCDEPMQDMQLVHDQVEQLSQTVRVSSCADGHLDHLLGALHDASAKLILLNKADILCAHHCCCFQT